jgi:hypothetical protein
MDRSSNPCAAPCTGLFRLAIACFVGHAVLATLLSLEGFPILLRPVVPVLLAFFLD